MRVWASGGRRRAPGRAVLPECSHGTPGQARSRRAGLRGGRAQHATHEIGVIQRPAAQRAERESSSRGPSDCARAARSLSASAQVSGTSRRPWRDFDGPHADGALGEIHAHVLAHCLPSPLLLSRSMMAARTLRATTCEHHAALSRTRSHLLKVDHQPVGVTADQPCVDQGNFGPGARRSGAAPPLIEGAPPAVPVCWSPSYVCPVGLSEGVGRGSRRRWV